MLIKRSLKAFLRLWLKDKNAAYTQKNSRLWKYKCIWLDWELNLGPLQLYSQEPYHWAVQSLYCPNYDISFEYNFVLNIIDTVLLITVYWPFYIFCRWADRQSAEGRDGKVHSFDHPFLQVKESHCNTCSIFMITKFSSKKFVLLHLINFLFTFL